ncbi:phage tail-collar fiber domain-containing protein [Bilophila wadsworthia]|uniref:phage tail-collar fiber domain-containing protein n=1 Tax=Bilophila wadsworthia TaxID=35833 RepID=UPI00266C1638|nr:phage tail protein [Bilophila wadsworthia]
MSQQFRTVTTNAGRNAVREALTQGKTVKLSHMSVGDGGGNPVTPLSTMTKLVNERFRAQINDIVLDPATPDLFTAELFIPQAEGGWYIREVGLWMDDGTLFAVGNTPLTEKPDISSGAATDLLVRLIIRVLDAATVSIEIDPAQVLATREYVDRKLDAHNKDGGAHETLARKSVQIKAGTGLTGGGTLEADRTLTVKYGNTAGTACQGNDVRLADARTPKPHKATHQTGGSDAITPADIGAAAKTIQIKPGTGLTGGGTLEADRTLAVTYGTAAGTVCQGNDSRLSNARTPTAHKSAHKTGGTDALIPADIGAVPTTVQVIAGTGLSGGGSLAANRTLAVSFGTTAGTVCQGNDSRLNNARTPVAHKATHAAGGADALTPEDIGAASNTVKIRAGVGLSGGGPLSNDVTLSAKLTDSVSSTDSTTAASATAVKTAYEAAQSKLPLAGGTVTGSIQINDPANVIGSAPSTDLERGLFLGDKNSVIMGGFDIIQHASDNAKRTQMFAKNASGAIASIAAVMYEDGTREISTDCPMRISDVQIERIFDNGVRLIKISGARGNEGYSLRFSPDNGQLYLDGREMHGKADTAGYADTAGSANALGGKAESALSVAFASEAQNAYGLKGMDMIIARTTYTLPGYGTWKYSFTVFDSSRFYDQVVGESPGGTTFSPVQMGWPEGSFMDGLAFRSA